MSGVMSVFVSGVMSAVFAGVLSAQAVQYRSPEGIEYRSLPDTGPIARAQAALAADPRNVEKVLALGAAQSAARQFREAIETYSRGLAFDSTNAMLYRWRGHRYLSIRDVRAARDLSRALEIDSANYGALYHLGIIEFARGDYGRAVELFTAALRNPPNAGELAGSTDWLWMSLMRAGRRDEAAAHLARRTDSLPVSNAYATRLKLYRGEIGPNDVFTAADTADTQVATLAYGLGNWLLLRGDTARAIAQFQRAIASGGWPAFGFIVAESELRRLRWAATRPNREFMQTYLRRLDSLLAPLEVSRRQMAAAMASISRTPAADSAFWRFRRTFAGKIDAAASVFQDSIFGVLVDPYGADAQQARMRFDRHLEPVARDSAIASTIHARLTAHGVWAASMEGATYLEPDQADLLQRFRRYLTPAGVEAAEMVADEQAAPTVGDASLMIPLDTLAARLVRAERFLARNDRHVAASDISDLLAAYRRFFITGIDNTPHFDWQTGELRTEVREAFARFVAAYPSSRTTRDINQLMTMLAQSGFRRTPEVNAYLRSFWR